MTFFASRLLVAEIPFADLRSRVTLLALHLDRSAIDQTKKKVTMLSPLPGRLPRKTLLLGSMEWQDA